MYTRRRLHLGPELLTLLHLPQAHACQLWDLYLVGLESGCPPDGACYQLLTGALVVVRNHGNGDSGRGNYAAYHQAGEEGGCWRLRRVKAAQCLLPTASKQLATLPPQEHKSGGDYHKCQLHLEDDTTVGLADIDARTLPELPEHQINALLCEHACWSHFRQPVRGGVEQQGALETLHRM